MKGKYVIFEGIDGAGKSTLCADFTRTLQKRGMQVASFAFPSRTGAAGKLIQDIFSRKASINIGSMQHLMLADQIDFEHKIRNHLADGCTVILDRHAAVSAFVYGAEHTDVEKLYGIVQPAQFRKPDLLVIVDVPVAVAMERRKKRGAANPIFESDDTERLVRLRHRYMARVLIDDNAMSVDGTKPTDELVADLISRLFYC